MKSLTAIFLNSQLLLFFLLTTAFFYLFCPTAAIGVNYGMVADNLPSPADVANFIKTKTIFDSVKIFDTNPTVLRAFANTNITMTVTIPNGEIPNLNNVGAATAWVNTNIRPIHPQTKIKFISVGNEVVLLNDPAHITGLVPAMRALTGALRDAGPEFQDIKVTTAHALNMFQGVTVPSLARFRVDYAKSFFEPLLLYLRETKSPLMINPYPYFELNVMENNVDYAVFRKTPGVFDPFSKKTYSNAFDSLLDKTFSAMLAAGFKDVDIVIGETGWPSLGDPGNFAATVDNAASYNGHLIRKIVSGIGTPLMPNRTFDAYIFALFNENQKPGPLAEKNWGLFQPDYTPVYVSGALRDGPAPSLNNPNFTVERRRRVPRVNNPQPAMPQPVPAAANDKKFVCRNLEFPMTNCRKTWILPAAKEPIAVRFNPVRFVPIRPLSPLVLHMP
ncbi:glucan endo-1,3-beta-glucosidase-like isoform X1 [Hibiscus syriacus]|nr:glucan endo-1,3-beta-glucosidase-like isoform X1 [Hibiscus syriacus]